MRSYPPRNQNHLNLIIISGKNPHDSTGGYAQYAKSLAATASSLGHTVHIFCIGKHSHTTRYPYAIVKQIGIPFLAFVGGFEMVGLLPLSCALAWEILRQPNSPGRFVLWGIGPWSFAAAIVKKFRPNIISVADYFTTILHEFSGMRRGAKHSNYPFSVTLKFTAASLSIVPFYTRLEHYLLTRADFIVTHYVSTQKILVKQFGLQKYRFTPLPYAVQTVRSTHKKRSRIPLIVTVARHDLRKGVADLIRAYHLLADRHIHFRSIIIGDGMLLKTHTNLVAKLKLHRFVTLLAHVKDISSYLDRASLFVLPSHEEGSSSLAVLEAMFRGVAVIATNVDGIPEDIEDGKSGILVPPANPAILANTIEALLGSPQQRIMLGKNARIRFRRLHGPHTKESLRSFLDTL